MILVFTPNRQDFYDMEIRYSGRRMEVYQKNIIKNNAVLAMLKNQLNRYKVPTHLVDVIIYLYNSNEEMDENLLYRGKDARGRVQYIYGNGYMVSRKENKAKIVRRVLSKIDNIKKFVRRNLTGKQDFDAIMGLLLGYELNFFIRMGKPVYEKQNQTTGLSTLRRRHFFVSSEKIRLEFTGKDEVVHEFIILNSSPLYKPTRFLLNQIKNKNSYVFQYQCGTNRLCAISPQQINQHLQELGSVTLKDLRTYGVNYLFVKLRISGLSAKNALKETANIIGHSPPICKRSYLIDEFLVLDDKIFIEFKINSIDSILITLLK